MKRILATPAILAGVLICGLSGPASAENGGSNSAESLAQENSQDDDEDVRKHFWFHREGVTPEAARADIEYCLAQTNNVRAEMKQSSGMYGLMGALIEGAIHSIIEGIESRRMRYAAMRMCMGVYGYARYEVPERQWQEMMESDDAVDRLTAYASGPAPATERLSR
jgi:hypothetical protein